MVASAAKKCSESVAAELIKEAALMLEEQEGDLEITEEGVHSRASGKTVSLSDVGGLRPG